MTTTWKFLVAAAVAIAALHATSPAWAQSPPSSPAVDPGSETGNWGLAPFAAVPTISLRPEDRAAVRALEDRHIGERRRFEDKYDAELRALISRQAEEREALRARLAPPR